MRDNAYDSGRRAFLGQMAIGTVLLLGAPALAQTRPEITVWKDPNCGCCTGWVAHLRRNGFAATVFETSDVQSMKRQLGIPAELASCHTAKIGAYCIEGHVPAQAIELLLLEKPSGLGLAVPGMPIGSPGMEGGQPETYDVVLFGHGAPRRFARFVGEKPV